MKKISLLAFLGILIVSLCSYADTIIMSDGTSKKVYNLSPSQNWIFYSETPNEDADIKKISIDKVFAYKIADGPLTTTDSESTSKQKSSVDVEDSNIPRMLEPIAAPNNATLIAAYNNHPMLAYKGKKPQPDKFTDRFISLWGIEEESILSDVNIEIGFEQVIDPEDKDQVVRGTFIKIMNKTSTPIYIDLASSYKIMNGGYAVPYFTDAVYTENSGNTKGGAINLGSIAGAIGVGGVIGTLTNGITIGGANNRAATITKNEQRILTIPPHSIVTLPGEKFLSGKEIIECYEPIYFTNRPITVGTMFWKEREMREHDMKLQKIGDKQDATSKSLNIRRWIQTNYTPEDSPKKIGRIITYSTSPDFSTYTSLPFTLYMRGAYGIHYNGSSYVIDRFNDKTFNTIIDKEHFISDGPNFVKK